MEGFQSSSQQTNATRITRAEGTTIDLLSQPVTLGNDHRSQLTLSDAARALLVSGNYLGAVVKRSNAQYVDTWSVSFITGWSNAIPSSQDTPVPEGDYSIYEIQLNQLDAGLLNTQGALIHGYNIDVQRVYISDYSHVGDNQGGNSGGDDTPFEPTYEPGSFSFDEDATSKQSSSDYSAYFLVKVFLAD